MRTNGLTYKTHRGVWILITRHELFVILNLLFTSEHILVDMYLHFVHTVPGTPISAKIQLILDPLKQIEV